MPQRQIPMLAFRNKQIVPVSLFSQPHLMRRSGVRRVEGASMLYFMYICIYTLVLYPPIRLDELRLFMNFRASSTQNTALATIIRQIKSSKLSASV